MLEKMAFKAKEDLKFQNLKKAEMSLQTEGCEQRKGTSMHIFKKNGPRIRDDSGIAEA